MMDCPSPEQQEGSATGQCKGEVGRVGMGPSCFAVHGQAVRSTSGAPLAPSSNGAA